MERISHAGTPSWFSTPLANTVLCTHTCYLGPHLFQSEQDLPVLSFPETDSCIDGFPSLGLLSNTFKKCDVLGRPLRFSCSDSVRNQLQSWRAPRGQTHQQLLLFFQATLISAWKHLISTMAAQYLTQIHWLRLEKSSGDHLAPTSAETRVNTYFRPGCSGLCPVESWKVSKNWASIIQIIAWSYLHGFLNKNTVLSLKCAGVEGGCTRLNCVKCFNGSLLEREKHLSISLAYYLLYHKPAFR